MVFILGLTRKQIQQSLRISSNSPSLEIFIDSPREKPIPLVCIMRLAFAIAVVVDPVNFIDR
jgi:hypothetical protein